VWSRLSQRSFTCHREERSDLNCQSQALLVIYNNYCFEQILDCFTKEVRNDSRQPEFPFSIIVIDFTGRGEAFNNDSF
jgi:hypothetical protein